MKVTQREVERWCRENDVKLVQRDDLRIPCDEEGSSQDGLADCPSVWVKPFNQYSDEYILEDGEELPPIGECTVHKKCDGCIEGKNSKKCEKCSGKAKVRHDPPKYYIVTHHFDAGPGGGIEKVKLFDKFEDAKRFALRSARKIVKKNEGAELNEGDKVGRKFSCHVLYDGIYELFEIFESEIARK
jgi:hypothetical protein